MELELVETSELLDELLRRFDHAAFAGVKGHDEDRLAVVGRYKGNAFTVAGLAQSIGLRAIDEWRAASSDLEPGEL